MRFNSIVGGGRGHVIDRLAEYFSGSLVPADERAVEAHLLSCTDCRTEYHDLGAVALLIALLPPGELDH